VTAELAGRGIHTWIGGRSRPVQELAARVADGWNCWEGSRADLATFAPLPWRPVELTWGGAPPRLGHLVEHLREMDRLGVAWVVYGPPPDVEWPRFMAKMASAAEAVR
jgi:hypothetical protein